MSECVPCETNRVEGWWAGSLPERHTHCRDCHVTFRANNTIGHCSGCHRTFAGTRAFDAHQVNQSNPCLDPVSVRDKGDREALVVDEQGIWHMTGGYFETGGPGT
jgi:hypothetical protein